MNRHPDMVDDDTVIRVLHPSDVLDVIARAFVQPPIVPPRAVAHSAEHDGRTLLAMPALRKGGISTVKVVSALGGDQGGLSSYVLALDQRGELLAVIEAHRLTALRTAAASVLAARTLGAGSARTLAVLGAGRQARAHIESYAAAMPIERLTVWARRRDAAQELADFARSFVGAVRVAATPDDAVQEAQIITSATPAERPLINGAMLAPGTHVDLVGGFRPYMREADDDTMRRAAIVVDTPAALTEAGDLVQPIASGVIATSAVHHLADVMAGGTPLPGGDITVFKSVGHAGEDLVVTELLLAKLGVNCTGAPISYAYPLEGIQQ